MKFLATILVLLTTFSSSVSPSYRIANLTDLNKRSSDKTTAYVQTQETEGERYYEVDGGFSYILPKGWTQKDPLEKKYKRVVIPGNIPAVIDFYAADYEGSLKEYALQSLDSYKKMSSDFKVDGSTEFTTDSGIAGYIIIASDIIQKAQVYLDFYVLDGGNTKYVIAYQHAPSEKTETDEIVNGLAKSFQIHQECTTPLADEEFTKAISNLSYKMPKGWQEVTDAPFNDRLIYAKNTKNDGDVMLMVFALKSTSTFEMCIKETTRALTRSSNKDGQVIGEFEYSKKDWSIDGKKEVAAIAEGFSNYEKKIPSRYAILNVKNDEIIYQFHFIASGSDTTGAKKAVDRLINDFAEVTHTIKVE